MISVEGALTPGIEESDGRGADCPLREQNTRPERQKDVRWPRALPLAALRSGGAFLGATAAFAACQQPARGVGSEPVAAAPTTLASPGRGTAVAADVRPAAASPPALLADGAIDWTANPLMRTLGKVAETMVSSEYAHRMKVDERRGIYNFDCSNMVDWALHKATPRAATALVNKAGRRPLARDFHDYIDSIAADDGAHAWRHVTRVADMEPGDVIAWIKPRIIQSPYTGHVAVAVLKPVSAPEPNTYLVRIADSTSLLHQDDTREGRSGFGLGTIVLVTDDRGLPDRLRVGRNAVAVVRDRNRHRAADLLVVDVGACAVH